MSFDHKRYNAIFRATMVRPIPDAKYGVGVVALRGTIPHWRCIGVHHLTGTENRGKHNCYLDCLDEDGKRFASGRFSLAAEGEDIHREFGVDKPGNEPANNFPMWRGGRYSVSMVDPELPSEVVTGLHSGHPDEDSGNTLFHHSFYVVFQRVAGLVVPDPLPIGEPIAEPPRLAREIVIAGLTETDTVKREADRVVIRLA